MTGLIRCARCGLLGCQECVRSYRERIVELESQIATRDRELANLRGLEGLEMKYGALQLDHAQMDARADAAERALASKEPVIDDLITRSVLAEADAKKCRRVLEKWAEYRFCCSDTPSKEKLDKMLADVEDATMELLGYKALVP